VARGLDRSDPDVRLYVVAALGRFKCAEATRWLAEALQDESPAVREAAILGLSRLGARGLDSRFNELARTDPSKAVRRAAAAAVARQRSAG
jgi:HEAT repeat protein